jgi:23S rRNA (adenine-N6)-dimethyltransferase
MRKFHNHQYTIKHSQNFLRYENTVSKLVAAMNLQADDIVVEIGPGTGQLTQQVAKRVATVLAIEKDAQLNLKLVNHFSTLPNLVSITADFLNFPLPLTKFKVIGNIPFAHTAEILRKLIKHQSPPIASYLIMQQEAAEKLVGQPVTTQMSLLLYPQFETKILTYLPRREFTPVPSVDAVKVGIELRTQPLLSAAELVDYQRFVTEMFAGFTPHVFALLKKRYGFELTKRVQKSVGANLKLNRGELTHQQWLDVWRQVGNR